jgi:hypothetical protein
MTQAKPVYHGNVYELTLHDFRDVYRNDRNLSSIHCIHRAPTNTAALLGFEYSGAGKSGFTRQVNFDAQTELHDLTVIPFERIQRTSVAVEIESITLDKYMDQDWMVFSFITAILEDDITSLLDIRSTSQFDLRKFRFRSKSVVFPYLDEICQHYASLHAKLDIALPSNFEKYVPPDEPA